MDYKGFLEEKFIELNQLKSMLVTYPKEYKENILQVMDRVCNQISSYLEEVSFYNKNRDGELLQLTEEELSLYNGENGMPAYIAVDGTIYDTRDMPQWKDGKHFGIKAGSDYSEAFKNCHNGDKNILSKLIVVGVINYTKKCSWEE
ncbi:cytochrome b5 domain-containing protein [Clostridium sp. D46t1_190503_E9]|uniref:cytochrome b5 domain-containing protein n=1 Tax=Clostridium sp. D46t1_190503_E9 TaxID=2787137 RepID=UPI00189B970A|nr:cytochrome b5 domain-containing protein [Clostridium sp. D46t1_190503_E9]